MANTPKTQLTFQQVYAQFDEQIGFLVKSCQHFDQGDIAEAKRLATSIRILVHDTKNSKSLLGQLGFKVRPFFNSAQSVKRPDFIPETAELIWTFGRLSLLSLDLTYDRHFYSPLFGKPDFNNLNEDRLIDFDTWWDQPVIEDKEDHFFSRKDIVLAMADKDGGAHVDPSLDDPYYQLTRENSVGHVIHFTQESPEGISKTTHSEFPESAAYYTVRQIAHEILVSMIDHKRTRWPDTIYPYNPKLYAGGGI